MSEEQSETRHVGQMDVLAFWSCNDCGLTLSPWSKRHIVGAVDDECWELDAPCPICRSNQWMQIGVIGMVETPDEDDTPPGLINAIRDHHERASEQEEEYR